MALSGCQLHHTSRVRAPGTSIWADGNMQVQTWLTHHWHNHGTCSPVGGQTLEKVLLAGKESRQKGGQTGWMGDVPSGEIM